jgi:hypothetical protein
MTMRRNGIITSMPVRGKRILQNCRRRVQGKRRDGNVVILLMELPELGKAAIQKLPAMSLRHKGQSI